MLVFLVPPDCILVVCKTARSLTNLFPVRGDSHIAACLQTREEGKSLLREVIKKKAKVDSQAGQSTEELLGALDEIELSPIAAQPP